MQKTTYIGLDETTLALSGGSIIVCAAETKDARLAEDRGYNSLEKAKDFLVKAYFDPTAKFPTFEEMYANGLNGFYWTRSNGGSKFKRQLIEHASIAEVVAINGYDPKYTVLLIDSFHQNYKDSIELIKESLHMRGFKIPEKNIVLVDSGDRSVPIINYADLIAFQIGLWLFKKHRKYITHLEDFPLTHHEVPYDEKRVLAIDGNGRSQFEDIINSRKQLKSKKGLFKMFVKYLKILKRQKS